MGEECEESRGYTVKEVTSPVNLFMWFAAAVRVFQISAELMATCVYVCVLVLYRIFYISTQIQLC